MKISKVFFNNFSWRKRPVQWSFDSNKHIINHLLSAALKGKLSLGLFSPSLISFNDSAIVRNFTLRSFSKICHQLEGNLHMITLDYRTASISF